MKKSILLRIVFLCSICLMISTVRAQYVAIPDSNFGKWLFGSGYSACLIGNSTAGWQLDTTCSIVLAASSIDMSCGIFITGPCYNIKIRDLTGITYFKNLRTLVVNGDTFITSLPPLPSSMTSLTLEYDLKLTGLPTLPSSLLSLNCSNNRLVSLPALPASLRMLDCSFGSLTSLPALPASLDTLMAFGNRLTALPPIPAMLKGMDVSTNKLHSLPALPASLSYLYCGTNSIYTLPSLPASLVTLNCWHDSLTSLPALPASLMSLDCQYNSLTSLPSLPASLKDLYCDQNLITSLPALPVSLQTLSCANNQLSTLPALPPGLLILTCGYNAHIALPAALPNSLTTLNCDSIDLTDLPPFPARLYSLSCRYNHNLSCLPPIYQLTLFRFFIGGTNIHCIPDRFNISPLAFNQNDSTPARMALCTASSGCPFYYNLAGSVHRDTAATCASDSVHPGIYDNAKIQLLENGQVIQQFYTCYSGEYSFKTDSMRTYTVQVDTTGTGLYAACPSSGMYTVTLSPADSTHIDLNFGLACDAIDSFNADYGVRNIYHSFGHFRPGSNTVIGIDAGDIASLRNSYCGYELPTADTSGIVTVTFSGPVSYVGPATGALVPSVSGNTLTYTVADLQRLRGSFWPIGGLFSPYGNLDFVLAIDTTATLGSSVCISVSVSPSTPDATPRNDTLSRCFKVSNSFDPNYKDVSPATISPDGGWLTYTVEFQNTGNDTAYIVVVKDTLSPYVDANSFQFIGSDHKAIVQLTGSAVTFTFPKINLVDSAANPALSTGLIQYKVKAKSNLPLNTQVANTAYIYFDYNPAVRTNTAVTTVDTTGVPLGVSSQTIKEGLVFLYPNPNRGSFTLVVGQATNNGAQTTNNSDYTISDMLGHIVEQKTITSSRQQINMTDAAEGVYTLVVKGARPVRFVMVK
jgi:uncharacterized repeat protein (TIGR01451 family)